MHPFKKMILSKSKTNKVELPLAYNGLNSMGGNDSNFNTARGTAVNTYTSTFRISCWKSGSNYIIDRAFFGFDVSGIVSLPTSGGITLQLTEETILTTPTQFVVLKPANDYPANHVWTTADYNEGVTSGVEISDVITVNPGQTTVNFTFNSLGLQYIAGISGEPFHSTFVIMQRQNDSLNNPVTPPILSGAQMLRGNNSDVRLYYF